MNSDVTRVKPATLNPTAPTKANDKANPRTYPVHTFDVLDASRNNEVNIAHRVTYDGHYIGDKILDEYNSLGSNIEYTFCYEDKDKDGKYDTFYQLEYELTNSCDFGNHFKRLLEDNNMDGYADSVTEIANLSNDGYEEPLYYTDSDADGKFDTVGQAPEFIDFLLDVEKKMRSGEL